MKCEDIANLLDEGELPRLPAEWLEDVEAHVSSCESCANEWRAVQALRSWRDLPTPSARPELLAEVMRRATQPGVARERRNAFLTGAGLGGALAACIVVAVMALSPAIQETADSPVPALAIALNEPHDVSVAIDSSEALMGAQIRVVLTGGIQLAGFDDQTVLSWTTDLDRGANRLTLPVIAVRADGGQVLVEVAHEHKRQIFIVDVDVASTVGYAPRATAEPGLASHRRTVPAPGDESSFVNLAEPPRRFAV
jgi:hypothetical protein